MTHILQSKFRCLLHENAELSAQVAELLAALKPIQLKFISGNCIRVDRAMIMSSEWNPVEESIAKAGKP